MNMKNGYEESHVSYEHDLSINAACLCMPHLCLGIACLIITKMSNMPSLT